MHLLSLQQTNWQTASGIIYISWHCASRSSKLCKGWVDIAPCMPSGTWLCIVTKEIKLQVLNRTSKAIMGGGEKALQPFNHNRQRGKRRPCACNSKLYIGRIFTRTVLARINIHKGTWHLTVDLQESLAINACMRPHNCLTDLHNTRATGLEIEGPQIHQKVSPLLSRESSLLLYSSYNYQIIYQSSSRIYIFI